MAHKDGLAAWIVILVGYRYHKGTYIMNEKGLIHCAIEKSVELHRAIIIDSPYNNTSYYVKTKSIHFIKTLFDILTSKIT